jgi:hypothetical protein
MAATKNNRIGRSRMRYLKAPLQVQAERPTSSPLNHGTPILRGRYCRRMKHDQATMCGRRRAGDDEMKQRDCRRHHSSCLRRSSLWCWGGACLLSCARGSCYSWTYHLACPPIRPTGSVPTAGQPQTVSLVLRPVSLHCCSVVLLLLLLLLSLPRRFRCDVDNPRTQRYSGQGTPQDQSDARYPLSLWSRRRAKPTPRLDSRIHCARNCVARLAHNLPVRPLKRAPIAKQMLAY